jgi:hypothetical protein
MDYLEIVLSFVVGILAAGLLAFVFSLKTKGFVRLIINIVAGCVALLVLSLFKVHPFSLSPLSAFLVGICGVPGLLVIFLIMTFL